MTENLSRKIKDLFDLRLIPDLISIGNGKMDSAFLQELIDLQFSIYQLDKSLEGQWDINHAQLKKYWHEIIDILSSLGGSRTGIEKQLYRLRVYVEGELAIRNEIYPSFVPIRPFYYFKSCDVKLIRELIYARFSDLERRIPQSSWILFDLVTEVNDDISDQLEDRTIYNGNRFLFSLYTHGWEETLEEYRHFVNSIEQSLSFYKKYLHPEIYDKTTI